MIYFLGIRTPKNGFGVPSVSFQTAVLGEHEVAQGIKEVHVIHEVPKEPSPNARW